MVMFIVYIDILSRQIMVIRYKPYNNFWFWASSFSIIYNVINLLIFGSYFFALSGTKAGNRIEFIQHYVNAACYVFFTVAIFQIPKIRSLQ
jgi:hypothetical protein